MRWNSNLWLFNYLLEDTMAAYLPVIQKEVWAQCENPNCQKWRKLPPSTIVNEDEPWYCYMNPDHDRNTCSASEVVSDAESVHVGFKLP